MGTISQGLWWILHPWQVFNQEQMGSRWHPGARPWIIWNNAADTCWILTGDRFLCCSILRNWWAGDKRRRRACVKGTGVGTRAPGFWLEAVGNFPKMDHVRVGKKMPWKHSDDISGRRDWQAGENHIRAFRFFCFNGMFRFDFFEFYICHRYQPNTL